MVRKFFQIRRGVPTTDKIFNDCLSTTVDVLKKGGVIVFPTETLYGLGVDVTNEAAIDRLFELKGRPKNMPISIAVNEIEQILPFAEISVLASRIIQNCLPRPITILLNSKESVNQRLTAGSKLIGFRFPENLITKKIIEQCGPITATSANLHGAPEPVTITQALEQFGDKVDVYIDSGSCKFKNPSTVIDTTGNTIKIIRHGVCSGKELEDCLRGIK
jgi:L-threonylcarbamoyladenylate synthase